MVGYKIMLGVCLLLLLGVYTALAAAQKEGDRRRLRVLRLFRAGLGLSAASYLLRLMEPPHQGHLAPFSFVTGFLGTTFLWLGWMGHWQLRAERPNTRLVPRPEEDEPIPDALLAASPVAGAFSLTARAHQVLIHAQYEAYRRHQCCVDTDHLLLGLLRDPSSAGVHILNILGTGPEKVSLELLGQMASRRKFAKPPGRTPEAALRTKTEPQVLTDRAGQVLILAAQEARRFDKTCVGTEHLLLGLVLMGKGKAAAVLFAEGITVEKIRDQIIKAKKAA